MPRLFVSVDLPDDLASAFSAAGAPLDGVESLRFTDPEGAHCTLKFLGDVPDEAVSGVTDALETAVADADVGPFDAEVGGVGAFPSREYISVVWVGVREGSAELTRLHEAVERETTALGFDAEDHEFTPHFTLARMDDARGKERVQSFLDDADPTVGTFRVEAVGLTESTLTDGGPEYSTVERVEL
ncbi:RNA 2',3'-cyclic phosphodiesterase [Candidatus Halobonum tyrrellensis]|uniref:RNA 2',3'-cyclic phosphodiesterase n=1 Tax=Candidatus Halobonum tyrrellensis G22 TaxID=1324957 RepID=V4HB30_9EURY|nr:RNA 2',3'-cyclic phosphodiesterase [Candidatus Halobonum tyrrellensis]ESP87895.1 2'-5' RNA ligase [Candidatus Halobonum tyrrellensis G22]